MRRRLDFLITLGAIFCCFFLYSYFSPVQLSTPSLPLGNPSGAISSLSSPNNYLLVKREYALSYNNEMGTPNWVQWELNSSHLGHVPRSNNFHPEENLPSVWRVDPLLYRGSGFDRGHLCPSGDLSAIPGENYQTFSMANMVPQSPDNNRGPWEKLEKYERKLARKGKQLYIIAGRIGEGGVGSHGAANRLSGRVSVPQSLWKVLIVLDRAGEKIGKGARAISVIMPNLQGIKEQSWRSYLTNIDTVEKATGYNLLSNLPVDVQNMIEATTD